MRQALDGFGPQLDALAQAERTGEPVPRAAATTPGQFATGMAQRLAREQRGVLITIGLVALALLALVVIWISIR